MTPLIRQQAETADAIQRRQALRVLQNIGPANVLTPAPTVRAGDESEYAFRVQQQRRAMQNQETRTWQQRMLRVLEDMRDANQQGAVEAIENLNIQMRPSGFIGVY